MDNILLITAALLGLLAFFEPCTIATHTLFAVRTHTAAQTQRLWSLAQLLISRTLLLGLLFGGAALLGLSALSATTAILMLSAVGLVYLISRRVYLPVPHVEFFRLLPRHIGLSQGLKLGLSLPACTLPLILIVGLLAALSQQILLALLAGGVFSVMFTLPTWWGVQCGLGPRARAFLAHAAAISPYLTALLLWGAAFSIWQNGV